MPIFKLCMKIIRKNLPTMLIYVAVLLVVGLIMTLTTVKDQPSVFTQEKANVVFLNEESCPLIDGFRGELSKSANFIAIPDQPEKLQDALFFHRVVCVIRIPKGFTQAFLRGENAQIERTSLPDNAQNAFLEIGIRQYFRSARLYLKNCPGISQEELVRRLQTDLSAVTPVTVKNPTGSMPDGFTENYFNYLSYTLSAVLIFGISSVMLVINNTDLRRRNFCSPVNTAFISFQFILALLVFTVSCWAIMSLAGVLTAYLKNSGGNPAWFLLNSFLFTLCASCLSFLIGSLLHSRNALSAVCNVVSVGPCFICGVFVPQQFLSPEVLKIASFTPTYWYVAANSRIASLTSFTQAALAPVARCMLMELGFALAFFAVAMAVGKNRRLSD